MAIFPCENKSFCLDPSTPFANFTAEKPDKHISIGRNTGFGPLYPPLGSPFVAVGCTTFCISDVSQEEADLCAGRNNVECLSFAWPDPIPGFDVFGNPVPIPQQRRIFANREQTARVQCPDGNPFTYTVPAGQYFDFNQAQADAAALSEATQKANIALLCISNLSSSQVCADAPYADSVTASGTFLNPTTTCWEILGVLPPGIQSDLNNSTTGCFTGSNRLSFFGVPTTPGIYSFAIQVTDGAGNFMVKPVTIRVTGITTTELADGQPFFAYSDFVEAAGVTNPIFAIEGGTLPAGLAFDTASGQIYGTPIQAETKTLVFSVTEAGTGITCFSDEITLEIVGPTDCENTPTNSLTHNDGGNNYNSLAIITGDKYLLALEPFTPILELFNISNGAFISAGFQTPNFSFGRIIWSPAANEWVHVGQNAAQLEVWFTSYNKTTLVQTGQIRSTDSNGNNTFQQWGMATSPTTARVYAACGNTGQIRSYNSILHTVGPDGAVPKTCLGSISLNDAANRLYVAQGNNDPTTLLGSGSLLVFNATTLAVVSTWALPTGNHGFVKGCVYVPDDGMVYVAGNDQGGDGGDVIWVVNPTTGAIVTTIRLLTAGIGGVPNPLQMYPTTLAYNSVSKQIYMFFGQQTAAPATAPGGIQIICTISRTKIAYLHPASDPNFGMFLGDVVFGTITNTVPPGTTDIVALADSLNGVIREYTFP